MKSFFASLSVSQSPVSLLQERVLMYSYLNSHTLTDSSHPLPQKNCSPLFLCISIRHSVAAAQRPRLQGRETGSKLKVSF